MERKLILHIPHSSTFIPFKEGYLVDDATLESEILKLTDWYTEDLFYSSSDEMIIANFSRIFCDPERFSDDFQEIMSKYGMGVLYEKTDDGKLMRNVSPKLREKILTEYYWKHHNKFNKLVSEQLEKFGKAIIVDCHSFPSFPLKRDPDQTKPRPDFNIGIDKFHTPKELIELSKDFFSKKGFTLGVDWTYSGSIVPLEYYNKNENVQTIMLEINRALYLEEPSNNKSINYDKTKQIVSEFLDTIRNAL